MPSLSSMAKDAKEKKSIKPKKPSKKTSPPPGILSTKFIQESDLEEDEQADEASSSEDEESLPRTPAIPTSKTNGKVPTQVAASDVSSSSGSESESAEDSESEEDEDEEPSEAPENALSKSTSAKPPSATKPISYTAPPYAPPPGFEVASFDGTSSASQLFGKDSLEGKQIWYITAPASVPISSIKEVSLANIQKGNAVLSHHDNKYGLVQDSSEDARYTKVMVPNSGDQYRTASRPIDRMLRIKEIVQLPSAINANAKASSSARPQPHGLKMRFHPIGFASGKLGQIGSPSPPPAGGNDTATTSDEEMEDAPGQFRRPASLESDSSTSSDEESSSSSDAEMADAPTSKPEPVAKSKPQKFATEASSKAATPLKRKHSEGGGMKVNSSSNALNTPNKELKSIKKKQKSSPADSQSVSIEAHKTPSKLTPPARISTSLIPPPKSLQGRSMPTSSPHPVSSAKNTHIQPPSSSQMSPRRDSQISIAHSTPKQPSERSSPAKDEASVVDLEAKQRKEAKKLKKEKSKIASKSGESTSSSIGASQSSSQVQNASDELGERKATVEKKKKKKREVDELENERSQDAAPSAYKSSPILPPKRSLSTIPPPNATFKR